MRRITTLIALAALAAAALCSCAGKSKAKVASAPEEAGPRLKMGKVAFAGNTVFTAKQLRDEITLAEGQRFDDFTFQQDLRKIIYKYKKKGYLDAKFAAREGKVDLELQQLDYRLVLEEGLLSTIGRIFFQGNSVLSDSTLLSYLKVKTGDAFNLPAIAQTSAGIAAVYAERGYVYAVVKDSVMKTDDPKVSDVVFRISEGGQAVVGRITIQGNRRVRTRVIEREMNLVPGEIFVPSRIYQNQQRVYGLGLFTEVRFEMPDLEQKRDTVDLMLLVREDRTNWVGFNTGYQSPDRVQVGTEWGSSNVFGNLQKLTVRADLSYGLSGVEKGAKAQHPYSNDYYIDYLEPYFLSTSLKASASIYYRNEKKYDEKFEDWLRLSRRGAEARVGRTVIQYLQAYLGYKYEFLEQRASTTSDAFLTATFDNRDDLFNPRRGFNVTGRIDQAGSFLGGSNDFRKGLAEASTYLPLGDRLVAAFRAKGEMITTYGRSLTVPLSDRLYLGGGSTLRGYGQDELSADSAAAENSLLLGNAELRYRMVTVMGLSLDLGAFGDAGNVWPGTPSLGWNEFLSDYGLGLRLITPVGPVRVDYGLKTAVRPAFKNGRVCINLGHAF